MTFGDVELQRAVEGSCRAPFLRNELRKEIGLLFDISRRTGEDHLVGRCSAAVRRAVTGTSAVSTHKTGQFSVSRSQSVCYL